MKLYNYNNVIALKANQHNYQNTKDGLYKKTITTINAIALQANQHNYQNTKDGLYKKL